MGDYYSVDKMFPTDRKQKRSIRAIVMSLRLKKELEEHEILSFVNDHDLVFCNQKESPVDPDNFVSREFMPALALAGLREIRFHDLRHTFSILLIDQGENIKFIQS